MINELKGSVLARIRFLFSFPLCASIVNDSPSAQLSASLRVLLFVLPRRCAEWALSRVPSVATRANTLLKPLDKEGAHESGGTRWTIIRHSEVVSLTH